MTTTQHLDAARDLGREAARSAAAWVADGNTDPGHVRFMLKGMEDGDPRVWDALPPMPDLSGQYADDPTPISVAREVLGLGLDAPEIDGEVIDAIADAWEEGVDEVFEAACEAELRARLA